MVDPGDVVTANFQGTTGAKRRPAVILSSTLYHTLRPDIVYGLLTSNVAAAKFSTDCVLQDWAAAGLRVPTAFRSFFGMDLASGVQKIGRLSPRDWQAVQACVRLALAV